MGDRRSRYTKMVVKESLLALMADKPINKITIKEICEKADINRGTFYHYYQDQFDLLKQVQDEFANEVKELLEKRQTKVLDTVEMITQLISYFVEQRSLCKILFSTSGNYELINRLTQNAYEGFLANWRQQMGSLSDRQLEMLFEFISNGAAAIIHNWTMNDMQEPPREVAEFIVQATNRGSLSFVE